MIKNTKKILVLILITITTIILIPEAKAATLKGDGECYYFHNSSGDYSGVKISSNYGKDCVKELTGDTNVNGKKAYCVEWGKSIKTKSYKQNTSWKPETKNSILAGIIIQNVNNDYSGNKAYGITSAALNTYFSKQLSYAASKNFYNNNDIVKKYNDGASKEYTNNGYTTSKTIDKPVIKSDKNIRVLDYNTTGQYYISKKITTTVTKTVGGDPVSYKISANKDAQICTTSSGRNCSASKDITNVKEYSFYVKVPKSSVSAGNTVKVTVTGTNSSSYPSTLQYIGENYTTSTQKLIVPTNVTINRSTNQSYNLTVPDLTQHMIKVIKVDENGNELFGSKLALYRGTELLKENTNGNSEFVYTALTPEESDDFFNHEYSLVELESPNGYVLNNDIIKIEKGVLSNNNTNKCYNTEGEEFIEADASRCDFENYNYVCLDSTGTKTDKVTIENNCEVIQEPTPDLPDPVPDEEEGEPTTQNETETPDGNTDPNEGGDNTGTEGDGETTEPEPEEPIETYTKVCYSNKESKEVDVSYCTDKEKYTKVQTINGNTTLIKSNVLNEVHIIKTDISGKTIVPGATLKICTDEEYAIDDIDCLPAYTVNNTEMYWVSTSKEKTFRGVPTGSYVIIEEYPPDGYEVSTTVTPFKVDAKGEVTSNDKKITKDNPIQIKNKANFLKISKQDITNSKELPGATLSICLTYYNEETKKITMEIDEVTKDCIPAVLANGTKATWTSTDKPYTIEGLATGTYYLVENIAPKDYSTAESMLFTVYEDGTITDENDDPIEGNHIIMQDEPLKQVKTGDLPIIAIIVIGLVGLATGVTCYRYSSKKYNLM